MIEISHLTKKYGNQTAVNDLSLNIESGRIYGFLGPNGAGKSTTMNIMTGYLAPTSGTVSVNGHDIFKDAEKAKACIGYLPEIPPLYAEMTVLEYLDFAAELKKIPKAERLDAVEEACITAGISNVAGRLIRNLSKGYKQRVGIAQAILGKPEIIILDEPTVGLDPAQIIEIRELITELGKEHTIILSSHILSEISAVCNYIFILSKGRLVAADTTEKLLTQMSGSMEIEMEIKGDADAGVFEELDEIDSVEAIPAKEPDTTALKLICKPDTDAREKVFRTAVAHQLVLLKLTSVSRSLEDVFLELTSGEVTEAVDDGTDAVPDEIPAEDTEGLPDAEQTADTGADPDCMPEDNNDETEKGGIE